MTNVPALHKVGKNINWNWRTIPAVFFGLSSQFAVTLLHQTVHCNMLCAQRFTDHA